MSTNNSIEQWRTALPAALAQFAVLAGESHEIDFKYGLLATAVMWPVRSAIQEFDSNAQEAVREITGVHGGRILKAVAALKGEPLDAARTFARATAADLSLRQGLDLLIAHFDAGQLFAAQLAQQLSQRYSAEQLTASLAQQSSMNATYTINDAIKAAVVNIGGVTNIQQLSVALDLPPVTVSPKVHWWQIATAVVLVLAAVVIIGQFVAPAFAGPQRMEGLGLNIAVADFGEVDRIEQGAVRSSGDATKLKDYLADRLRGELASVPGLQGLAEVQANRMGVVTGDTPEQREKVAQALAQRINADIVIYGYIETGTFPPRFWPRFYVSDRLSGAEESTGDNAFGRAIQVNLPVDVEPNKTALERELLPRYQVLSAFMKALAYYKANDPVRALAQLESARTISGWNDDDGKEILYLWIGRTIVQQVLQKSDSTTFTCPNGLSSLEQTEENEFSGLWRCASAAYHQALAVSNGKFARAYIGLGTLWYEQALSQGDVGGFDCGMMLPAEKYFNDALRPDLVAEPTAYLAVKATYNIGLTKAQLYLYQCSSPSDVTDEQLYQQAISALNAAMQAIDNASAVQRDTTYLVQQRALTFYHIGRVQRAAVKYPEAIAAFQQTIAVAQPTSEIDEANWRLIRWSAANLLGDTYLFSNQPEKAIAAVQPIVQRYNEKKYSNAVIIAEAYLTLGQAQQQQGNLTAARASYQACLAVEGANEAIRAKAQEQLQTTQ